MKRFCVLCALCGFMSPLLAEQFENRWHDSAPADVDLVVDVSPYPVDCARDFYLTVKLTAPSVVNASLPKMDARFEGFRVPETNAMYSVTTAGKDGRKTTSQCWRLIPNPSGPYRLKPFVVQVDDKKFLAKAIRFEIQDLGEMAADAVEIDTSRESPPFSWKRVGLWAGVAAGILLVLAAGYLVFRKIRQIVRVHRMSPYERALYELDRLLRKGLPCRGLYKDFYVELTMVVRRYIERRHGVRAPNLTTDEFLRTASADASFPQASIGELKTFLESADLVKFAGLESTPEMADGATGKALNYLTSDNQRKEGAK